MLIEVSAISSGRHGLAIGPRASSARIARIQRSSIFFGLQFQEARARCEPVDDAVFECELRPDVGHDERESVRADGANGGAGGFDFFPTFRVAVVLLGFFQILGPCVKVFPMIDGNFRSDQGGEKRDEKDDGEDCCAYPEPRRMP
jgi:hypothetical protein